MAPKPRPQSIPCPECGKPMILYKGNYSRYVCSNEDCPLIEIRLNRFEGDRYIYAADIPRRNNNKTIHKIEEEKSYVFG